MFCDSGAGVGWRKYLVLSRVDLFAESQLFVGEYLVLFICGLVQVLVGKYLVICRVQDFLAESQLFVGEFLGDSPVCRGGPFNGLRHEGNGVSDGCTKKRARRCWVPTSSGGDEGPLGIM